MSKDVKRKNQKGFTLIELIVVIAILGILAAILLPQFGGFTDRARGAQIRTDAQAIATALDAARLENPALATQNYTVAAPAPTTDTVVSLSGVPTTRISTLTYNAAGDFTLTEVINSVTHTAQRTGATGQIQFNP